MENSIKGMIAAGVFIVATLSACGERCLNQDDLVIQSRKIISQYKAVFNQPPLRIPFDGSVDSPLLGNGDMGVTFAGPPEKQTFYIAKNDFWKLVTYDQVASSKVFGHLVINTPALEGASYKIEQDIYSPVAKSTFVSDKTTLTIRTWLAATVNVLVLELSAANKPCPVTLEFFPVPDETADTNSGNDDAVYWIEKKYVTDVDIPTAAACAMKIEGAKALDFVIMPGTSIKIKIAMQSLFKNTDYLAEAKKLVLETEYNGLWKSHVNWWEQYWAKSFVEIGDPVIERYYYLSNYSMGACSRDKEFPPGIFGTWVTTNKPRWEGDYHMNYNFNAPFYGLYSSNHIEQTDTHQAPIIAGISIGQWFAREITNCSGVLYPVSLGPKGIFPFLYSNGYTSGDWEKGGWFGGQKSNAAYQVVNMTMRWRHTYDLDYAREVYPYILEVVAFWEDYLKFQNGRYVIEGDSVHEGSGDDTNPIHTLGLVRNVFDTALEMSDALGVDRERQEKYNTPQF